jgi:CMP-2-keto-3-deoxyoctulosonic acid synthetase
MRGSLDRVVDEPPCVLEKAEKLEQLRALHLGLRIRVLRWKAMPPGVDTPGDAAAAEAGLRARWPELAARETGDLKHQDRAAARGSIS